LIELGPAIWALRIGDIAQSLNTMVCPGKKVSTFNAGTDQYNVRVRAIGEFRASVDALKRMNCLFVKGRLGQSRQSRSSGRRHWSVGHRSLNRQRQVTLLANVRTGGSQAAVITKMNQFAKDEHMDSTYKSGLAGRSKELGRAGYYFMLAFVLSFVFITWSWRAV